jgi:hypothetical protein
VNRTRAAMIAVCLSNAGYPASLRVGHAYRVVRARGTEHGFVRVVDDTWHDYLYPASMFRIEENDS